jgi:hypothetical protein
MSTTISFRGVNAPSPPPRPPHPPPRATLLIEQINCFF